MMRKRLLAVAATLGASLLLPVPAGVAHAGEGVTAYVWANRPSAASYDPVSRYAHNSTGGDVRVDRAGPGTYTVTFEGAAPALSGEKGRGGVVHAVAYGARSKAICTVARWGPAIWSKSSALFVDVRCFDPAGKPADTRFVANFTNVAVAGKGRLTYFWTDRAVPDGERRLTHPYQYDSRGGPISYERLGVGRYRFSIPPGPVDLRSTFPMVHVTAYHAGAVHCQVGWPDSREVRCVDASGDPVDSRFTLTYGKRVDLLGQVASGFGSGTLYADEIHGDRIFGDSYVWPAGSHTATGRYLSTGRYQMTFPDTGGGWRGHAFVNTVGESWGSWPRGHCVLARWWPGGPDQNVGVRCYDFDGDRADLNARVSFTGHPAP